MQDETRDMISRLNLSGKRLSKGHRRIAEYIVQHYDKAVFMTAARLGEMPGVQIGHVKAVITADRPGCAFLRATLPRQAPDRVGSLEGDVGTARLRLNAIVLGIEQGRLSRLVAELFSPAMLGARPRLRGIF